MFLLTDWYRHSVRPSCHFQTNPCIAIAERGPAPASGQAGEEVVPDASCVRAVTGGVAPVSAYPPWHRSHQRRLVRVAAPIVALTTMSPRAIVLAHLVQSALGPTYPRSPLEVSVDRAVDLCREANPVGPRSQGPTTKRSGAYVEEENVASGAKTKRGALTSSGLRGSCLFARSQSGNSRG